MIIVVIDNLNYAYKFEGVGGSKKDKKSNTTYSFLLFFIGFK